VPPVALGSATGSVNVPLDRTLTSLPPALAMNSLPGISWSAAWAGALSAPAVTTTPSRNNTRFILAPLFFCLVTEATDVVVEPPDRRPFNDTPSKPQSYITPKALVKKNLFSPRPISLSKRSFFRLCGLSHVAGRDRSRGPRTAERLAPRRRRR